MSGRGGAGGHKQYDYNKAIVICPWSAVVVLNTGVVLNALGI